MASSGSLASTDAAARAQLFEDLFEVVNINPEGKKFERGTALEARGRLIR